jgi:hypothetical protein
MDMYYLYKLKLFILYLNKNLTKDHDLFKGVEKFIKLLLFLLTDFVFYCFERLFESQDDSFWVFWYLVNVGNLIHSLDTMHQILFRVFFAALILSLCPLISTTLEKRWEVVLW